MSVGLSLPEVCERIEGHLVEQLPEVIQRVTADAEPHESASVLPSRFVHGDVLFEVRAKEGALDSSHLTVAIGEFGTHWDSGTFRQEKVRIEGAGRFTSIDVQADQRLAPLFEEIVRAVQNHFQHAYRYLEAHALSELLNVEHQLGTALYMELRSALDEERVSNVWLYALTADERAMYMLDPMAIQKALSASRVARPSSADSPITLTALLATGWVKEEDTVARHALAVEEPTKVRLQDLRYTTTPGYDLAEVSVYGTEAWVQPLVREGRLKLFAGYPADLRPEVQPVLDELRPRLQEVVADHAASIRRILGHRSQGKFWNADRMMELFGHFFGAAADTYTK